jgi:GH35 family endo-1,4-beta-xylanase
MSWEHGFEHHRAGVLRLVEGFRKRGTPVDALGIQSHIKIGPVDERAWRQFCDEVVGMGYRLLITEFDAAMPPRHRAWPARCGRGRFCPRLSLDDAGLSPIG